MKLIALYSPYPQCGKSTVAEYLDRKHNYVRSPMAGPLKEMLDDLLRLFMPNQRARRHIYGDLKEAPIAELGGLTSRRLMQTLGTEWGRALDPAFWLRVKEAQLAFKQRPSDKLVVDDMRFPNEYDMLKARGAVTVKIVRCIPAITNEHISEGQLNGHDFDYVIPNLGTIGDLHAAVDQIIAEKG